jgi:elongator complex protein 1
VCTSVLYVLPTAYLVTPADATHLLPHLFQFPMPSHRAEGQALQAEIADFEKELRAAIDEVWTKAPAPQGEAESEGPSMLQSATLGTTIGINVMQEGWAKRMRDYEFNALRDPLDKVQKPDVGKVEWKERLAKV